MPNGGEMPGFEEPPLPEDLQGLPGFPRKKIIKILAFCGLVLVVIVGIGKGFGLGRYWPFGGLDIEVSKPEIKNGAPAGTFTMISAPLTGLESDGSGGACLVADIAAKISPADASAHGVLNISCTSDAQCDPMDNGTFPSPQPWWGYCVPDPDKENRRCWYKPDPDNMTYPDNDKRLCAKSKFLKTDPSKPWQVGVENSTPQIGDFDLKAFYARYTPGQTARWRVIGEVRSKSGQILTRYGEPVELAPK